MPRWPALSEQPPPEGIFAELTITVKTGDFPGMMGSVTTDGHFSDPTIEHRFYSFNEVPPAELPPIMFWGVILSKVGAFMLDDLPVSM